MIRAIKLPADPDKKVELVELEATDADAYRAIVNGALKVTSLRKPASTLYSNDDGQELALPLNENATHIAWCHNREMRGHNLVLGDAILVGPFDRRTYERSVPKYFREVIFHEGNVTVEYRREESRRWVISALTFREWSQAYEWGASFMHQTPGIVELRVVPL